MKPQFFPAHPLAVETRLPEGLPPYLRRRQELSERLTAFTKEMFGYFPLPPGVAAYPKTKAALVDLFAELFAFQGEDDFGLWLRLFTPDSQRILRDLALEGAVPLAAAIAQKTGDAPLALKPGYRYDPPVVNPETGLGFLNIKPVTGGFVLTMHPALCDVLRPWFVYDDRLSLESCRADGGADEAEAYGDAPEAAASVPLLCAALPDCVDMDEARSTYAPLAKKYLAALRLKSGFKPFPETGHPMPDALDLAARFIALMTSGRPRRPEDGRAYIKKLVEDFLALGAPDDAPRKSVAGRPSRYDWYSMEYHLLLSHLKKKSAYWDAGQTPPKPRVMFRAALTGMARSGGRFSAARLARFIALHYDALPVAGVDESAQYFRADSVTVSGARFGDGEDGADFYPRGIFRAPLLIEPLVKGYCALFAALGLLEITWREPAPIAVVRGRPAPVSAFDAVDAARVTPFGLWCLGLADAPPQTAAESYEAIADRDLYLVTVRGTSFERSVYLDSIGERLGEDRWRISPRSFIANCKKASDVEERVRSFRRLIDNAPAPHWERLFARAQERAGVLNRALAGASVYDLSGDPALFAELARDPALAACALRAEGGRLVVPDKHRKKFLALAAEHGITVF